MLNKKTQLLLTDLLQDQFTDLDIYREKPFTFKSGGLLLIVSPVSFKEHDLFLKDMSSIIIRYYEIFSTLDFLNSYNYKDKDAVKTLTEKVTVFTADKRYSQFKKDTISFVSKWSFVCKEKDVIELHHNKKLCLKFIKTIEPSEFIYILFLLFCFNFSIVKKNLIQFMKMFRNEETNECSIPTDTSSPGISKKGAVMPKFSIDPYSKSTLSLLEQQSKMN